MKKNTLYEIQAQGSNAPADEYVPKEIASTVDDVVRTIDFGNNVVPWNTASSWDLGTNMERGSYDLTMQLLAGNTFALCGWPAPDLSSSSSSSTSSPITTDTRQSILIDGGRVEGAAAKVVLKNMKHTHLVPWTITLSAGK